MRRRREDHGIARRANAILLLDDGKSCQKIAEFLYTEGTTIPSAAGTILTGKMAGMRLP